MLAIGSFFLFADGGKGSRERTDKGKGLALVFLIEMARFSSLSLFPFLPFLLCCLGGQWRGNLKVLARASSQGMDLGPKCWRGKKGNN